MDDRGFDLIPMRKSLLFVGACLIGLCVITVSNHADAVQENLLMVPLVFGCSLWLIWDSLRSYRLDTSGITVYRFGKAIRRIPWDQIEQIGIARTGGSGKGRATTFLLIVPKGCERFDPVNDIGHSYCSRNRKWILRFDPPEKYKDLFEKYYGAIDFDVRQYDRC